jgi:hypothetical protein
MTTDSFVVWYLNLRLQHETSADDWLVLTFSW